MKGQYNLMRRRLAVAFNLPSVDVYSSEYWIHKLNTQIMASEQVEGEWLEIYRRLGRLNANKSFMESGCGRLMVIIGDKWGLVGRLLDRNP